MFWGAATATFVLAGSELFWADSEYASLAYLPLVNAGAIAGYAAGRAGLLKREELPWINVGSIAGAAVTYATLATLSDSGTVYILPNEAAIGSAIGAVGGAVAGHYIGRSFRKARGPRSRVPQWHRVLRPVPSVSVTPQGDLRAKVQLAQGQF